MAALLSVAAEGFEMLFIDPMALFIDNAVLFGAAMVLLIGVQAGS